MIEHRIPDEVAPMPLERYLQRAWPMLPEHVVRDALKRRDVRVNGMRSGREAQVAGGDLLRLYLPEKWFAAEPEILFEDGRLIIAVKPQGLPVDVDRDFVGVDTLLTRLRRRWPSAKLCHRLDAATGGIVMAAAHEETWQRAFEAFQSHGVRKEYRALAFGRFERPQGTINAWLAKDARSARVRILQRPNPGAKPIETRYRVGDIRAPGLYDVLLEPVPGRTHQLRAHMADFGHPLLGDDQYGDRAANRRYPGVKLCLWHQRLSIPAGSPLVDYAGRTFFAPAPDWLSGRGGREEKGRTERLEEK